MLSNALGVAPMPVPKAVAQRLVRSVRHATGLSTGSLARTFGVEPSTVWRWSAGERGMSHSSCNLARLLIHDPSLVLVLRVGDVPRSVVRFARQAPENREALAQVLLCLGDDAGVYRVVASTIERGVRPFALMHALGRFAARFATLREPTLDGLGKHLDRIAGRTR